AGDPSQFLFDAYVTKLSPAGALVYSTYLGGDFTDEALGIAVDPIGSAHIVGYTNSDNFPHPNAYQSTRGASSDVFVAKLTASPPVALVYSTYLGGSGPDFGNGITLDGSGNAIVVGDTASSNFPILPQAPAPDAAFQQTLLGSSDA